MSDNPDQTATDLEVWAKAAIERRRKGDIDGASPTEREPDEGMLGRVLLKMLGEPTAVSYVASEKSIRGITHHFRMDFQVSADCFIERTEDGKIGRFSLMPVNRSLDPDVDYH